MDTVIEPGSHASNVSLVPECFCAEGYELTQKRHCKALGDNATLVVANENTLRHLDPYGLNYLVDVDEERSEGASKIQVGNMDLLRLGWVDVDLDMGWVFVDPSFWLDIACSGRG